MLPINFPESNIMFTRPDTMKDDECSSIPAFVGRREDGLPCINTVWMPSKEDREAINAGRPIVLHIIANRMIPVSLFTYDENGNTNE